MDPFIEKILQRLREQKSGTQNDGIFYVDQLSQSLDIALSQILFGEDDSADSVSILAWLTIN
jgi:hypothetical protein